MKRVHIVLLAVAAATVMFSAYSLAAINQTYNINYDWYSQYYKTYKNEFRDTQGDKWFLLKYPHAMEFRITQESAFPENTYVFVYCTLGDVKSPVYRIKVIDIAQRGGIVEIRVSTNSPSKQKEDAIPSEIQYYPEDKIRVDRTAFPVRGKLLFVFKNQNGRKLFEEYFEIK